MPSGSAPAAAVPGRNSRSYQSAISSYAAAGATITLPEPGPIPAATLSRPARPDSDQRVPTKDNERTQCRRSVRVGRLEFAGCSASRWNIRCGARREPLTARRHRPGLRVPGRQPLQVSRRRCCQAGAGCLGAGACGKPVFVGLDGATAGSGDAWAGFCPASASAAWPAVAGHLRRAAGLTARRRDPMPGRAAAAVSSAMAIETVSGLEEQGTAACFACADQGERESTRLPSGSSVTLDRQVQHQRGHG